MSTVIKISNLSKIYRLGEIGTGTISRDLERWYKMRIRGQEDPFLKIGETNERGKKGKSDVVFALKDLNFEVQQGDALGIIGKNGAGKSTLLKILSRVTSPTSGQINIKGRIASLLEVGTGFHPELTGRENIYLNGAILGMRKKEIARKLDEIIDFSGVERYVDTPVKRYSSGMYVRLAFAVAAHLESEIMIVDEVLAVGDAEFQKKCLGKMDDVNKGEGRTLLFVSHNMTSIQSLCTKAYYLLDGKSEGIETVNSAVNKYLGGSWRERPFFKRQEALKKQDAFILEAELTNSYGKICDTFTLYDEVVVKIRWENLNGVKVNPNFMLVNRQGVCVMVALDTPIDWAGDLKIEKGEYISIAKIPGNLLNANDYFIHLALDCGSPRVCFDSVQDALSFKIWDPMDENCLGRGNFSSVREDAILLPALDWTYKRM